MVICILESEANALRELRILEEAPACGLAQEVQQRARRRKLEHLLDVHVCPSSGNSCNSLTIFLVAFCAALVAQDLPVVVPLKPTLARQLN